MFVGSQASSNGDVITRLSDEKDSVVKDNSLLKSEVIRLKSELDFVKGLAKEFKEKLQKEERLRQEAQREK